MKLIRFVLATVASFAIASTATANPVSFTVTSVDWAWGSGYLAGATESTDNKKLDVNYTSIAGPFNFGLNVNQVSNPFQFGKITLLETCIDRVDSCNSAPGSGETNALGVNVTFYFSSPYAGNKLVTATGTATPGPVNDQATDLFINFEPVTVNFGTSGQFLIDVADLSFTSNNPLFASATIKLVSADAGSAAEVPEPASLGLLGLGLLGAGVARRRGSKKSV